MQPRSLAKFFWANLIGFGQNFGKIKAKYGQNQNLAFPKAFKLQRHDEQPHPILSLHQDNQIVACLTYFSEVSPTSLRSHLLYVSEVSLTSLRSHLLVWGLTYLSEVLLTCLRSHLLVLGLTYFSEVSLTSLRSHFSCLRSYLLVWGLTFFSEVSLTSRLRYRVVQMCIALTVTESGQMCHADT